MAYTVLAHLQWMAAPEPLSDLAPFQGFGARRQGGYVGAPPEYTSYIAASWSGAGAKIRLVGFLFPFFIPLFILFNFCGFECSTCPVGQKTSHVDLF